MLELMMISMISFLLPVPCITKYNEISENYRRKFTATPYARNSYLHVYEMKGLFNVCYGHAGTEVQFGRFVDVKTAALVAKYAKCHSDKDAFEIAEDLNLQF